MNKFRIIKWLLFAEEKPLVSGEYLVIIKGAEIPTVLSYDALTNDWLDDVDNYYCVKYWCYMPSLPGVPQEPIVKLQNKKYALYLSEAELISFRECLAFAIAYCDLPTSVQSALKPLLVYLENMEVEKK